MMRSGLSLRKICRNGRILIFKLLLQVWPMYNRPEFIIDAYKDWVSDNVKNEVVIPHISMHGSVEKMVQYWYKP